MPRYIDADKLKKEIELLKVLVAFARQSGKDTLNRTLLEYRKAVLKIIDEQPPADVAPKSEVERWRRNLEAVLEEIPETKREIAQEIFAEIERTCVDSFGNFYIGATHGAFAELKKKYTEEFYETKDSHESL